MTTALPVSTILLVTGFLLALVGLWGMLTHRNIMRIIICFTVFDMGLRLVMVATGYITAGTAPIIDTALGKAEAASRAIDPIPSALVVTAIVIGFAVTAVMLGFAIRLYAAKKTLSIDAFTESKW
jgi:multisubunit Na+/H+ antiporter MnhC subunit